MSLFVSLSWILCLSTSLWLVILFARQRFLFIKPSFIVLSFFHVQIQWAAALQSAYIENFLPQPYSFLLLAQVFPFLGAVISSFILRRKAEKIFQSLSRQKLPDFDLKEKNIYILLGFMVVILFFYLSTVPLSRTGLYAIFTDPSQSHLARESSLKLLDSAPLKYAFSWLKSVLAPLLSVLLMIHFLEGWKKIGMVKIAAAVSIFLFTLAAVSLPGARRPAAILIFVVLWAFFLNRKLRVRPAYVVLSLLIVLLIPVLLTIFRQGRELNLASLFDFFRGPIFERTFHIPMEVGLWHVHYAQDFGFFGLAGVPKLAVLFGVEPVDIPNLIFHHHTLYNIESGSAVTSFVFSYYSCFGLVSFGFSMFGLWALDLSLFLVDRLKNNALQLATVASLHASSIAFVSIDYTTALITNGFILLLILPLFLDRLSKSRPGGEESGVRR